MPLGKPRLRRLPNNGLVSQRSHQAGSVVTDISCESSFDVEIREECLDRCLNGSCDGCEVPLLQPAQPLLVRGFVHLLPCSDKDLGNLWFVDFLADSGLERRFFSVFDV